MSTDPFAPHWLHGAIAMELAAKQRDRHPYKLPRLHYSQDLSPDACARKTFYGLRFLAEPSAVDQSIRAKVGDEIEKIVLEATRREGKLIEAQVPVKPLRPSAWCWEGTADALVREPDGLYVWEVKSVEQEIAKVVHETGRLDLVRRERHLWQLAAYRHGLAERLGSDLKWRVVLIPLNEGPLVLLTPPLPSRDEIIAREVEVASLMPSDSERAGSGASPPEPERLSLVHNPKKKIRYDIQAACRWCSYRLRCGVDEIAATANHVDSCERAAAKLQKSTPEGDPSASGHNPPREVPGCLAPVESLSGSWTFDDDEPKSVDELLASGHTLVGEDASRVRAAMAVEVEKFEKAKVLEAPAGREVTSVAKTDADIVNDLCDIDHGLTEWEVSFIESVAEQVIDNGRNLTDKQRAIVERILDEKG